MNTSQSSLNLLGDIWSTGNYWARRIIIGAILWPLLILFVGLVGSGWLTALFAIVSAAILALLLTWLSQPLIPVVVALTKRGRILIRWVVTVFTLEVALGVYLSVVPVSTNSTTRGLAVTAVLCMVTAMLLKVSQASWKLPVRLLWWSAGLLTLLIFLYSWLPDLIPATHDVWLREQAEAAGRIRRGEPVLSSITSKPVPQYPICSGTRTYEVYQNQTPVQVPIQPDCWSGWIKLPTKIDSTTGKERSDYKWWDCDSPGELEFLLANGQRILLTGNEDMYGWVPPDNRFRLRGVGPYATVTIEK